MNTNDVDMILFIIKNKLDVVLNFKKLVKEIE